MAVEEISELVKNTRRTVGMSQAALARAAGTPDAARDQEALRAAPLTQSRHCAARRCNLALGVQARHA